jgi:hypothetical protein
MPKRYESLLDSLARWSPAIVNAFGGIVMAAKLALSIMLWGAEGQAPDVAVNGI